MIEETGQIVVVDGAFAWVETERRTACDACAVNKGCGSAALARVLGRRRTRVRVLNTMSVEVGEQVVVGIEEQALVRGSFAVYAVPLLALMAGAAAGAYAAEAIWHSAGELAAISGGLLGLAAGFLWLGRFSRTIGTDRRYQPVILRRVNHTGPSAVSAGVC